MTNVEEITDYLYRVRQPLADYQEQKGIPKEEVYSFSSLFTALCQNSYNAIIVILSMLYNLSPMVDAFFYLLRFVLDQIIQIVQSEDMKERYNKLVFFLGQLLVLAGVVFMISTLIVFPIYNLICAIVFGTWKWIGFDQN